MAKIQKYPNKKGRTDLQHNKVKKARKAQTEQKFPGVKLGPLKAV